MIVDELFKPARKKFKRRRVVIKGLDDLWNADLAEFGEYVRENRGYKYVLVVIDSFSKYLWTRALKSKTGEEVTRAMGDILDNSAGRIPSHLQTDWGKEFYNVKFRALMNKHLIKHYSTYSVIKSSFAERVIRTLKERLYKAFYLHGSHKWINILENITDAYNATIHSTTNLRPKDISKENEAEVMKSTYNASVYKHAGSNLGKFHVGDIVRISREKHIFVKGYRVRWSTELFKIKKVQYTEPLTYLIEDMQGNPILGAFYEKELQLTRSPEIYLVEKVLRRKNGKLFVKWLGLPKEHNSWIKSSDIK